MICPVCGNSFQDDSDEESKEPCPTCKGKMHHIMKIECTVDCGANGVTRHDGVFLLDNITKLILGRGFTPLDIDFLEDYSWREMPLKKDELRVLQLKDGKEA